MTGPAEHEITISARWWNVEVATLVITCSCGLPPYEVDNVGYLDSKITGTELAAVIEQMHGPVSPPAPSMLPGIRRLLGDVL